MSPWQRCILIHTNILFIRRWSKIKNWRYISKRFESILWTFMKVKVAFMLITYYFSGQDGSFPSSHIALQFLQTASKRTSLSFCHSADVSLWNNAFLWSLASVPAHVHEHDSVKDTVTRKFKRSLYLTQLATSSRTSWVRRIVAAVADWKAWVRGALAKAVVHL